MLLRIKNFAVFTAMLFLVSLQSKATNDPIYTNQLFGKSGQLQINNVLYTYDGNFLSFRNKIEKTYAIRNIITFAIDEESQYYIPSDFVDTISVEITSKDTNNVTTVSQKELIVNYAKAEGAKYQAMAYYIFDGGVDVIIKILSLKTNVSWDVTKVLKLTNEIRTQREWSFNCSTTVSGLSSDSVWADEWKVSWNDPQNWQTEYDLEWAWIDESAVATYQTNGVMDMNKLFTNNATRITTVKTFYKIPLTYDGTGRLYVRIRNAQTREDGFRTEAPWSYGNTAVYLPFNGHEDNLNWEASTSFAEEGKRKTVIQYFDGSLRSRQTVTKDNTSNTTVVAETMYDYQGRAVIQVLPAPTLSTIIGFTKNFNQFDDAANAKSVYDKLDMNQSACSKLTAKMRMMSGASQYYSPNNPLVNEGTNNYIPDADGYVFSETRYTNDGTGRVDAQSGVGATHQVNAGHDTKYFYDAPDQQDLDALFGTDAGISSHYSRTWVKDANGQYSVSYTDMHGRTVATALAGTPPTNVDALPSAIDAEKLTTKQLIDKETNTVTGNSIISSKPLILAKADSAVFNYHLSPEKLQMLMCTGEAVCFDCLYELNISIIPDCSDKVIPNFTNPVVKKNFTLGQYFNQCTGAAPLLDTSFRVWLQEGAYTIVKELKLSKEAQSAYRENVYLQKDTCKTLQDFITTQYTLALSQQHCYTTCTECNTKLGTLDAFRIRFKAESQLPDSMMTVMEPQIVTAYNTAKENCGRLCNQETDGDFDELQSIKDVMLQDMTPPLGQYARTVNANILPFNIFGTNKYKAPYDYNTTTGATTAATGYKDNLGVVTLPLSQVANMSIDDFTQNFDPQYANQLLYAHPEFCKLKVAETTLKGTYRFASKLQNTNDWTTASQRGYITSLMAKDSFFIMVGQNSTYGQQMQAAITNNFVSLNGACGLGTTATIGIWKLAKLSVFYKNAIDQNQQTAICVALTTLDNDPPSTAGHCQADMDMVWNNFKAFYTTFRNSLVSNYLDQQCHTNIDYLFAANNGYNYQRRFIKLNMQPPYTSEVSDIDILLGQGGSGDYDGAMAQQADDICRANATGWSLKLRKCSTIDDLANTHSSQWLADSAWLVNALVFICKPGVDYMGHPFGAASLPDSKPAVVISDLSGNPRSFRNFPDIIRYYLAARSISIDQYCYPQLIDNPAAYNVAPPTVPSAIYTTPSTCECARIDYFNTLWQNAGSPGSFSNYLLTVHGTRISADTLSMLMNMCNTGQTTTNPSCNFLITPITLPAIFQCRGTANPDSSKTCINCADYVAIKQAFLSEFGIAGPIDEPQNASEIAINKAFADFANYRTGFRKLWTDYVDFGIQCVGDSSYSCTSLNGMLQLFYQSPEYIDHPMGDSCKIAFVNFMNSHLNANKTYDDWMGIFLSQCGSMPTVCQPYLDCAMIKNIIDSFYNVYGVQIWRNSNCEAIFTAFFNAAFGTNYTFLTITQKHIKLCGVCTWYAKWLTIAQFPNEFLFTKAYNKFKVDNAGVGGSIEDCRERFVIFFNTYFGLQTSYWGWDQIYSQYRSYYDSNCGPDINTLCNPPYTCSSLKTLAALFMAQNPLACATSRPLLYKAFADYFNNYFNTQYSFADIENLYIAACGKLTLCEVSMIPDCASLIITMGETYPSVPGHCEESFANYFNTKFNTNYTYDTLLVFYANCGITLTLNCDTVPVFIFTCDQLTALENAFLGQYVPSQTSEKCIKSFTDFFNSNFGTDLDFATIKAYYIIICGKEPVVCPNGLVGVSQMQAAINDYMSHYGNLQLPLIVRQELFTYMFNKYMNMPHTNDPLPDPNVLIDQNLPASNYSFQDIEGLMQGEGGLPASLTIENQYSNIYNAQVLTNFKLVYYLLHSDGLPEKCSDDFTAWVNVAMGSTYDYATLKGIYNSVLGIGSGNICSTNEAELYDDQTSDLGTTSGKIVLPGGPTMPIPPTPGPMLCGLNVVIFPPVDVDTSQCHDPYQYALQEATEKWELYIDSIRNAFDVAYYNKCTKAKDLESFTVTYHTAEYHYTLYYYDQAGNLVKTVPAAGVNNRHADPTFLANVKIARANCQLVTPNHTLATEYRYNTLGQVVAQRTPDAGSSKFWYDRLGRLVVSQNSKQAVNNDYSYTLYDALGRISEVAQLRQATAMSQAISRNAAASNVAGSLANWLYNKAAGQITRTVYDKTYFNGEQPATLEPQLYQRNLRNRVSYTAVYATGVPGVAEAGTHTAATFYSYDIHGNVDTLLQDLNSGAMKAAGNRFKKLVYNYDLISGKVNSVAYQPGRTDAFYHRYSYDADNRLTDVVTSHDKIVWEHDANYSYYKHGPLARTVLGQQQVQGIDYAYNLQGWLKGINSSSVGDGSFDMGGDGKLGSPNSNIARDAYGISLNYFNGDYRPIALNTAGFAIPFASIGVANDLFNGNIRSMVVNIPKLGDALAYGFRYDQLQRLKNMDAYNGLNNAGNTFSPVTINDYKERLTYDANGNIKTYQRNGTGATVNLNNYSYTYTAGSNRLASISNSINAQTKNYSYDPIGNTSDDGMQGITGAVWNVYGKLQSATNKDGASITYTYSADGQRISKTLSTVNGQLSTEFYVKDAGGNTMATYKKEASINSGHLSATAFYKYGSSLLGIKDHLVDMETAPPAGNSTFMRGEDGYILSDHRSNTMVIVNDKKIPVQDPADPTRVLYYLADVRTANYYSAYGANLPSRSYNIEAMRYGFNGQMKSPEVGDGHYTALYWEYQGETGRRWNLDPRPNPSISPYATFNNNPIWFTDKLGDTTKYYNIKTGAELGTINNAGALSRVKINDKAYAIAVGVASAASFELKNQDNANTFVSKLNTGLKAFDKVTGLNTIAFETGILSLSFNGSANAANRAQADGTLNVKSHFDDGSTLNIASYQAIGGPWGNGAPENGHYTADNLQDRSRTGWYNPGMNRDGVGFSMNLNPQFATGRSQERIHPDGNVPGTQGCIGLQCDATQLNVFRSSMHNYLQTHPNINVDIDIENNPNNNGRGRRVRSNGE